MKSKFLIVVASALSISLLSGCSMIEGLSSKDEEVVYELTPVTADALQDKMFYVKDGDQFYPVHMGRTNIDEKDIIAKESNPTRVISFTKDDVMIPTLYKDDQFIYHTTSSVPTFVWERFADCGYSIGAFNLKADDAGKVQFVVGESKTNPDSDMYAGLSQIDIADSVIIFDKVAGESVTADRLGSGGSVKDLKPDEMANTEIYVGTQHYTIESHVDTHILSSMELYQTNEYNLMPEGYASVKIPDYFMSGYYFVNGVGVVRYVDNNRSEGIPNIDFSVPYFYKDEYGKQYTYEEWAKLTGMDPGTEEKIPDYEFSYDLDSTLKSFSLTLTYDLLPNEDTTAILYVAPSATITSPTGDVTDFQSTVEDGHQVLKVTLDGAASGQWNVAVYDLGERPFNVASAIESGNADSFIHSGTNDGRHTIYSDGVSGYALATVKWENATRAANITIKSPSGVEYSDTENRDLLVVDGYGQKSFLLNGVEQGNWELKVKGEDLGRVWFTIEKQVDTTIQVPETTSETDPALPVDETSADAETETEASSEAEETEPSEAESAAE